MFLLVQYAAGMRLNEAAHLKISDIDSQRMQLRIGNGKGQKTRIVPMAPRLLTELREYWKVYRPSDYLFPGKTPDVPLKPTTIQKMCKVAAKETEGMRLEPGGQTARGDRKIIRDDAVIERVRSVLDRFRSQW